MARKFLFPSRKGYLALETPEAAANAYLGRGPDWLHEIKYDGYRLRLEREGDRVRSNPQIS
jgi:ATP-dependent DNA ligase